MKVREERVNATLGVNPPRKQVCTSCTRRFLTTVSRHWLVLSRDLKREGYTKYLEVIDLQSSISLY